MSVEAQWKIDLSIYDDMDRELRDGMQDLVDDTAHSALAFAEAFVPNLRVSRGYATGALALSGYVTSIRGSGYGKAVSDAQAQPKSRIAIRNQILPEFDLNQLEISNPNMAFAAIHFPTTYASLIRNGFDHTKAKKKVIGIDYITSAENKVEAGMQTAARKLMSQVADKVRG
jgi:hypothetical protein